MGETKLPYGVEKTLSMLKSASYEAYLVGGCVRDSLLGRNVCDYDVTTSALPEQVKEVFADHKVIETGIKHGTVTVIIDRISVEVTTFRSDGTYSDGRHPDSVRFSTDLYDDLSRRDFTVNALCWDGERIIDRFDGLSDLKNRIIRCVGSPEKRFNEDALRILRAIRFSSVLSFGIEAETDKALRNRAPMLERISRERIRAEIEKLLLGRDAARVLSSYRDVFRVIFPECRFDDDYTFINKLPPDAATRLAALFLKEENHRSAIRSLKGDNKTYEKAGSIIENYGSVVAFDELSLKKYLRGFEYALEPILSIRSAKGIDVGHSFETVSSVKKRGDAYKISMLAVNGSDLASLGYRGERIGAELERILDGVMAGKIKNNKKSILETLVKGDT